MKFRKIRPPVSNVVSPAVRSVPEVLSTNLPDSKLFAKHAAAELAGEKRCKKCKTYRPYSDFFSCRTPATINNPEFKDGFFPICKICSKDRKKLSHQRKRHKEAVEFFEQFERSITPPESQHAFILFNLVHKNAWFHYLPVFNEYQTAAGLEETFLEDLEHKLNVLNNTKDKTPKNAKSEQTALTGLKPSRQRVVLIPKKQCNQCKEWKNTYWWSDDLNHVRGILTGEKLAYPDDPRTAVKVIYNHAVFAQHFERSYLAKSGWSNDCRKCKGESDTAISRIGTGHPLFSQLCKLYTDRKNPTLLPISLFRLFPTQAQYSQREELPFLQLYSDLTTAMYAADAGTTFEQVAVKILENYDITPPKAMPTLRQLKNKDIINLLGVREDDTIIDFKR